MARLSVKQRLFAAGLAAGLAPAEAMTAAGYPAQQAWRTRRNAANPAVLALAAALRGDGDLAGGDSGPEDAALADDVSRSGVTRMLSADRRLAYRSGAPGAAVAASVAIARINGLIVDRHQLEIKPLARMSDAELLAHLRALEREARAVLAIDVSDADADDR